MPSGRMQLAMPPTMLAHAMTPRCGPASPMQRPRHHRRCTRHSRQAWPHRRWRFLAPRHLHLGCRPRRLDRSLRQPDLSHRRPAHSHRRSQRSLRRASRRRPPHRPVPLARRTRRPLPRVDSAEVCFASCTFSDFPVPASSCLWAKCPEQYKRIPLIIPVLLTSCCNPCTATITDADDPTACRNHPVQPAWHWTIHAARVHEWAMVELLLLVAQRHLPSQPWAHHLDLQVLPGGHWRQETAQQLMCCSNEGRVLRESRESDKRFVPFNLQLSSVAAVQTCLGLGATATQGRAGHAPARPRGEQSI